MCGICGVLGVESAEQAEGITRRMMAAIEHRGPDDQGIFLTPGTALGMRRLSIIDLAGGHQPVFNEARNVAVVFNGEIYNYRELRAQLERHGHEFRTHSDTEVIAHGYEQWGQACLREFRGMFTFALWDGRTCGASPENAKVFIARDRLGIKPLYFYSSGRQLFFASEVKGLLASGLVPQKLDPAGMAIYLQLGHIPPPWTAIQGITPLEPGHYAVWQNGTWTTKSYWEVGPDAAFAGPLNEQPRINEQPQNLDQELAAVFLDAMRCHLISDVPVLMFLSGGTDSACLAAAARHAGAANLSAMTVGFGEAEFDESELSARTAQALDIPLQTVTLDPGRVAAGLDQAIWALDQPSVDGLNSYWISKLAAEAGFKVAISGQGGDELFGGYESLAWFERFTSVARWARPLPAALGGLLDSPGLPYRWRKLSYLVGARDPFVAAQLAVKVLYLDSDVKALLAPTRSDAEPHAEANQHLARWSKFSEHADLRERLALMDIHTHLEPRLLRDLDAMSMAHSLEVRPVFLDHRLVEFMHRIPSAIRMQQKRLLLRAARHFLPASLLADLETRKKRTFTFPFKRWLTRDLQRTMQDTFSQQRVQRLGLLEFAAVDGVWRHYQKSESAVGWSRIWSLFVLQRWCETMKVSL